MGTTIVLIIIAILVTGLGVWSWWFENGSVKPENTDESESKGEAENKDNSESKGKSENKDKSEHKDTSGNKKKSNGKSEAENRNGTK
ncbi:MAG: hypothetical protein SO170_01495 [Butyribacter sp.]|nr:hypothetical protein [bacterium]MDY3853626.1 hypothetical protein [Butyribacter sp.]